MYHKELGGDTERGRHDNTRKGRGRWRTQEMEKWGIPEILQGDENRHMGGGLEKSRGGNSAEEGRGVALLEVVDYRWRTRIT